jgi:predicted adenylyl cyclase CyaB
MQEIEIRSVVDEENKQKLISSLLSLGFVLSIKVIQQDIIFDKEDASLFKSGCKIRVRLEDNKKELTYKGSLFTSAKVSKRVELNIPIDTVSLEDISDFLASLGYPMCFQYKKERKVYKKDKISVSFDEWPIIGCMVEIEGEEKAILALAKQIAPDCSFGNRRLKDFFADTMKATNKSFEQLKKEYQNTSGFNLGKLELIL